MAASLLDEPDSLDSRYDGGIHLGEWRSWERAAAAVIADSSTARPDVTEPGMARTVLRRVPDGTAVVVSSSMPVRDVEWYAAPRGGVTVHANRGANGIDGVVSTAIGVALSASAVRLVGDLASCGRPRPARRHAKERRRHRHGDRRHRGSLRCPPPSWSNGSSTRSSNAHELSLSAVATTALRSISSWRVSS
ncbi:MAG: hypothetical protein U5R31_14325 [Acidimicrobiia bacterium]|nr:hypothetical protein [Acidimicrobiia bacterium]